MYGLTYSVPYQVFILGLIFLALLERGGASISRMRVVRFLCIAMYLLFIGLRGYIGTDWYSYRLIFDAVPELFSDHWDYFREGNLLEAGFVFFTSGVKSVWNNYHFFVFVNACLDMVVVHLFLKRYVRWYALGFLVFMVMGGLTLCELLRNARSIGLFLLSLKYLSERRPWAYFALNLLGVYFHATSIFYLPLYFILHRRWPKATFAALFLAGNLLYLLRIEFMRPIVEWGAGTLGGRFEYLQQQYLLNEQFDEPYRLSIGYAERVLTSLLVWGFYRKLLRQRETNVLFINAFVLYIGSFFLFSEIRVFAARFSLLFIFSYWALIPALYEMIRDRAKRMFFLVAVFIYCWLKIVGMTSHILYRYDNVLWGIEQYDSRAGTFDYYYLNR